MASKKRTPNDLIDDIYNLAYWMTGSREGANHLVFRTYLNVTPETPAIEIFKTFRNCYQESFVNGKISCIPQPSCKPMEHLGEELVKQEADVKLTILLKEIAGLTPETISKIIGKPTEIIKSRLSSGRSLLAGGTLSSNGHGKSENVPEVDEES
ncbi:MAG: RNA polymerase subunit sigma-24 [Chlorobiaceae bacterium]|jgi:hypothetical protein|nr:RNA polymerase subunit sigma-24 [Chlorobiaceae bacterium]